MHDDPAPVRRQTLKEYGIIVVLTLGSALLLGPGVGYVLAFILVNWSLQKVFKEDARLAGRREGIPQRRWSTFWGMLSERTFLMFCLGIILALMERYWKVGMYHVPSDWIWFLAMIYGPLSLICGSMWLWLKLANK